MDTPSLTDRLPPSIRQYYLPILLSCIGLIFLGYGLISYLGSRYERPDIVFETLSDESNKPSHKEMSTITVDIEGAVAKPGVYSLSSEARIQDGVLEAGGFTEDADSGWIARHLNLASQLTDGAKVYIPFVGEGGTVLSSTMQEGGKSLISINTASQIVLEELSAIGPVTASKIIDNRPYDSLESLVSKGVITRKLFDKIKDKISL